MDQKKTYTNPWDERFSPDNYFYGEEPNEFFQDQINALKPGKALFPAEGEGRNAVYASKLGWEVYAFDTSAEGRRKALKLAEKNNISINYQIASYQSFNPSPSGYDLIVCIYAHTPNRREVHQHLLSMLRTGGIFILEGFSKEQMNYSSGGPKNPKMLFSISEIESDFNSMTDLHVDKHIIFLSEGENHFGKASVIRMVGKK